MRLRLTYAPKGGERQEFILDDSDMTSLQAETLEEIGGTAWETFMEWLDKFQRGSFKAWRAALWVCMQTRNPSLQFDAFQPAVSELEIENLGDEPEGKDDSGDGTTDSPSPEPDSEPSPNS